MENKKQINKSFKKKILDSIKTYLITGLMVVMPLWLICFIVTVICKWAGSYTYTLIDYFIGDEFYYIIRISCFFGSIISIIILGFITNKVFGKSVLNSIERLIEKLPILGMVYSAAKQFINLIFGNDSTKNFSKVIFVPYPNKEVYSVGFLTGKQMIKNEEYICAFMPTTPNLTSGFLFLFKEKDIIYTDYTLEQAFQFIISAGVIDMNINDNRIEFKEEIKEIKNDV
jgi:uncharacterized membrane protein